MIGIFRPFHMGALINEAARQNHDKRCQSSGKGLYFPVQHLHHFYGGIRNHRYHGKQPQKAPV